MKILAIETSCDDTGIAILETKGNKTPVFSVLSNIVSSQTEVHKKYGGVYPAMAKREHQRNLVPVLINALKQAKLLNPKSEARSPKQIQNSKFKIINSVLEREPELCKKLILFLQKYEKPDIDLIAITNGPGLEPCLWVGVNFAKALSYFWNIPVVPVNHIESHILVNFLNLNVGKNSAVAQTLPTFGRKIFPAVSLVVSGGHTQLILMEKIGKYKILGETRDDAAGECFDKCAKILGLGYPGGPIISKLADRAPSSIQLDRARGSIQLPRPMINTKDYDFSFSGLKTAVLYHHQKQKQAWSNSHDRRNLTTLKKQYQQEMSAEIQQAIIDVLLKKTIKAAKDYNSGKIPTHDRSGSRILDSKRIGTIILGGGVSANQELRKQFDKAIRSIAFERINLLFPPANLSTDNGLMTAITGYFHRTKKIGWRNLRADANLRVS